MSQDNRSTDVRESQAIYQKEQARELTEKLSPIDLRNLDFEEVVNRILAIEEIREDIGEEHLDEYRQALMEDAGLGSKRFLDLVRWYNNRFPDNPILIPSDYGISPAEVELPDWLIPGLVLRNGLTLFYGDAGSYKTTLTIYMGYSLMTGTDFFNIPVDGNYKVLYVEQDESISILKDQLQKIGYPEDMFICCRLPVLWNGKEFNQDFHNSLKALKPDVVFIDAYTSLGIEDITKPQSAYCLDTLRRIASEYEHKISMVIIHHENLQGKPLGVRLNIAKVDVELQTRVVEKGNRETVMLAQGKVRGEHLEPIFIEANKENLHLERRLNMSTRQLVFRMKSEGMRDEEVTENFAPSQRANVRRYLRDYRARQSR